MTVNFLRCIFGVVCAVVVSRQEGYEHLLREKAVLPRHGRQLTSVENIGCPSITLLNQSNKYVSLVAGGETSLSALATNMSCTWIVPTKGRLTNLAFSFLRLPAGANITIDAYPGDFVLPNSHCNCSNDIAPVCSFGQMVTYQNNCTAMCAGLAVNKIQFCPPHPRTLLQGDLALPLTIRSGGGAYMVRYIYDTADATLIQQYVQLGFNFTVVDVQACFRNCSGHGLCNNHTQLGVPECNCEPEWKGADCSVHVPFIRDRGSLTVKSLCPGCWFFAQFFIANTTYIGIEVDSITDTDSDPFVVASKYIIPSLTRFDRSQSWVSWTYEDSQLRLVTWDNLNPTPTFDGPYYIGVVNHPLRAKQSIDFVLTLRLGNSSFRPCIHNCSGNGECYEDTGTCNCSAGSTGVYCEETESEIKFGQFKGVTLGPLRMGQWSFWHFDIEEDMAFEKTVMVSFQSFSPRAYPFVGVRKGSPPVLDSRFLPTFDAFQVDFADNSGFDLLKGHRQTVIIPPVNLTAGRYFVGVFNLWGRTGLPQTSHTSMNYSIYVDSYDATPCPISSPKNTFCGESRPKTKCDTSRGVCKCAMDELGAGCFFKARPLPIVTKTPRGRTERINPGVTEYFYLSIANASNLNLRVIATRLDDGNASLVLLARKGAQPFDVNFTYYDVRDLQSLSGLSNTHSLTLDHSMLSPGVWYFAVINSPENEDTLEYTIEATMSENLSCVTGLSLTNVESECSGQGVCQTSSGTCICNPGFTGTDCGALGIPHLGFGGLTNNAQSPPIPIGKWAYWSFALPCKGVQFLVQLRANTTANIGAAPLLVVRYKTLPMQLDGTYTLVDYYNGELAHKLPQAIELTDCVAGKCVVNPLYDDKMTVVGTAQNIGWEVTPPGIYYIGIYNDRELAKGPLSRYAVGVRILDSCQEDCGDGFVGVDCEELCPGMLPIHGVSQGLPCSGQGICYSVPASHDTYFPRCVCDADYAGPSCALQCRSKEGVVGCSGHGKCVADREGVPYCLCDANYVGADCSLLCPGLTTNKSVCNGRGQCAIDSKGVHCKCDQGFAGALCEMECPERCNRVGMCVEDDDDIVDGHRVPPNAQCRCLAGYVGPSCALQCPLGVNNVSCSGWGACVENKGRAVCMCHGCCEDSTCSSPRAKETSDIGLLTILATVAACLFCLGLFTAVGLLTYRRRRGRFVHFIPNAQQPSEARSVKVRSSSMQPIVEPASTAGATSSTTALWRPPTKPAESPTTNEPSALTPEEQALRTCIADIPEKSPVTTPRLEEPSVSLHLESLKSEP